MSKFKVGDRVRLSEVGRNTFIRDEDDNPHNGCGVISRNDGSGVIPWRVAWEGGANWYDAEHLELVTATTRTLTVGETYTSHNGYKWLCIAVDGDLAWMRQLEIRQSAAFCFKTYGENICQSGGDWDIKLEPVVEWVEGHLNYDPTPRKDECVYTGHHDEGDNIILRFPLIDGKPDWSQATVTEA